MWKVIESKPNYEVSDYGEVRNIKTGRVLKQSIRKDGYSQVMLGRKTNPVYIHRLVAEAFITNKNNLPQVDHINGVKSDNNVHNLRWVDVSGNYYASGYMSRKINLRKAIRAINVVSGEVVNFDSRNDAANFFKCSNTKIKYGYVYKKGTKKNWYFELVEDIV